MKNMQNYLLSFIENQDNSEENYQILISYLNEQEIFNSHAETKSFIHLLCKILNNHYRSPCFFNKIEKILLFCKESFQKFFSNFEIFNIFKRSKKILLFLIKQNIFFIDKCIFHIMSEEKYMNMDYLHYFYPEIKNFLHPEMKDEISSEISKNFEEKRKIGENDDYICELIRNDSIEEFIIYVNKLNISLSSEVKHSIFETNLFLLKEKPTLIEYSAFFGSVQIFKYLYKNGVKLTPSLWIYAIHSLNPEIIHYFEDIQFKTTEGLYKNCFKESIKCHHNEIGNYIFNNYLNAEIYSNFTLQSLKYYNFCFIECSSIQKNIFLYLVKYDYIYIVDVLLKDKDIDINQKEIYHQNNIIVFLI